MITDITFCANSEECAVKEQCHRVLTNFVATGLVANKYNLYFAIFEPEKGEDCKGYYPTKESETLTYAEKTVQAILDVLNRGGTQSEMIEVVEKAMQAQREECVQAAEKEIENIGEKWTLHPSFKHAILNAEVTL